MNRKRSPQTAALTGLLLILVIAVVAAGFGNQSATTKQAKAASQVPNGIETLQQNFSILREGDAPSNGWQTLIREDLTETYRLAPALARTATTGEDGVPVTVVPGEAGICFTSPTVGSCATIPEALASGIAVVEFCAPDLVAGKTRLTALLPDGATPATITGPGEGSRRVEVPQNALVHIQSSGPSTLSAPTLADTVQLPQGDEEVACG